MQKQRFFNREREKNMFFPEKQGAMKRSAKVE